MNSTLMPSSPLMGLPPRHIREDEEPEPDTFLFGWEETDEAHGYCRQCGLFGHAHEDCSNVPFVPKQKPTARMSDGHLVPMGDRTRGGQN